MPAGRAGGVYRSPAELVAAAVVVASREKAEQLGATILAEVGKFGTVAGPDNSLHSQPANAIKRALAKAGKQPGDLDLIEINEAFAAVGIHSMRELGVGPDKVNVNGGAIALGHPIGATGSMLIGTALDELERTGGRYGLITMCAGGGMAPAIVIERV